MSSAKDDFGFFFEDDAAETIATAHSDRESAVAAAKQIYNRINSLLTC